MTAEQTGDGSARVHPGLEIPVRDGTVRATRHEPTEGSGPRPVVMSYTPYHKDDLSYTGADPEVEFFVDRGYEVVVADLVGTGASTGLADAPFTASEGVQGAAAVEWVADREWCTGAVGLIGKSYPGTTALEIAAERPDGLEAIVPIHAPYRVYGSYFDGGALALLRTAGLWAPNFEFLPLQPPARRDADGRWAALWADRLEGLRERDPYLFQYLDHREKDDYWASKDVPVEEIETPTLAVGGYRDAFAESTLEYVEAIPAPTRLVLGPWRHAAPDAGRTAAIDFLGEVEAWFDEFLRGEDRDVLSAPPVRYWTARPGDDAEAGGVWRGREDWPRARGSPDGPESTDSAQSVAFAIDGSGLVDASDPSAVEAVDPVEQRWQPDYGVGVASVGFEVPGGRPLDTTADDARSITRETAPLDVPLELTGSGRADLVVVPETEDPLVAVRVLDVAPDGTARLVTHGVVRSAVANGDVDPPGRPGADPEPLAPGEATTVTVPLRPRSHVFEPGHRLRVAVSGAFFPYVQPPGDAGGFDLVSTPETPSTVHLPGRRHEESVELDGTVSFDPPRDEYVPEPPAVEWETTHGHTDGTASVSLGQAYSKSLAEAEFDYEMGVEARIERDDPTSAVVDRYTETTLTYPTETVVTRVASSASAATATVTYRVEVDGETVFTERKRWTPDSE